MKVISYCVRRISYSIGQIVLLLGSDWLSGKVKGVLCIPIAVDCSVYYLLLSQRLLFPANYHTCVMVQRVFIQ